MARKRLLAPMGSSRGHALARANMMSAAHPISPAMHPAPVMTRRSYDDTALFTPYRPSLLTHHNYDSTGHDNYTRSEVNRELYSSTAAMQDNFDIAHKSRNRDKDVLSAASRAIRKREAETPSTTQRLLLAKTRAYTPLMTPYRDVRYRSLSVPPPESTDISPLDLSSHHYQSRAPLYSRMIRTSPSRSPSPYRSRSPYRSISPYRSVSPYRSISPFSRSGSSTPTSYSPRPVRTVMSRKRRKPRVVATKRRFGNYYDRLLARRASQGATEGKYWPYLDVEDLEGNNVSDLLSDEESLVGASGYSYANQTTGSSSEPYTVDTYPYSYPPISFGSHSDSQALEPYEHDTLPYSYSSTPYVTEPDSQSVEPYDSYPYTYRENRDYIPSYDDDDEYVPFRPRVRHVSPERDYSKMSVVPYLPKRNPGNSVADDIAFNAIVAASAERARKALECVNWSDYDSAGLVLSVEGEYRAPESESPLAFRYISRPIPLKTPANIMVSAYDSDNSFTKYMTDMSRFREGIRTRLDEGYRALSSKTSSCVPSLTYTDTSLARPSNRPYRSYLQEPDGHRYSHSLELFPLTSTSETRRALTSSSDVMPASNAIKLYESPSDSDSRISTLSKIKIKVDTELHASPKSAVAARRAMRGHSTPPAFSQPRVEKKEAALLANKVEITRPERKRRPRSLYAQNRLREMRRDYSADTPVAVPVLYTGELTASKPVYKPALVKPIHDVDGVKRPNIMSWQLNEPKASDRIRKKRERLMRKHAAQ